MKTKNKISLFIFLLAGTMTMTIDGCKKYPDGPMFSIHSRTERVANTWKVDNYKKNGNDYTSLFAGYTETYSKDGNFSYAFGNFSGTGTWTFQSKDTQIQINGINNQSSETLYILKLEEKEFWYYYMDGNDRKEFHMVQN